MAIPTPFKKSIARFTNEEQKAIASAYSFAKSKHSGQLRKSGKPYIIHPLAVAKHIAENQYDAATVIGALLHDTLEDTKTTSQEIKSLFGQEIANIVNGVTKISKYKIQEKERIFSSEEDFFLEQVDNYRKLLFSALSDIRVMIIKLYDRLDNAKTIQFIATHKQKFYARETIEIFAPIAERLGIGEIKGQLEDLSFPYAYPKEYKEFKQIIKKAYKNPKKVIEKVIPEVKTLLTKHHIKPVNLQSRAKHHYSLYLKLKRKKDISLVFDIIALRIILHSVEDCYKTLGIIHAAYRPIPGNIDDYIARPKENDYQSLHTTVKDEEGHVFEVQIRTDEMHQMAEYGSNSHWSYKDASSTPSKNEKRQREWLEELTKIYNEDGTQFLKTVKEELFARKIFVFTPKGDIVSLPAGSSGIDLAYRIHTNLGHSCKGIKINGRMMPINTELNTGDRVEIIVGKIPHPSKDWLSFVKTQQARNKIKNFLKQETIGVLAQEGEKIFNHFIEQNDLPPVSSEKLEIILKDSVISSYKQVESVYAAIAEGNLNKTRLLRIVYPAWRPVSKKAKKIIQEATVSGLKGIRHAFANCCKARPTDKEIIGYLGREHIIKVHKKNCKKIAQAQKNRLIEI